MRIDQQLARIAAEQARLYPCTRSACCHINKVSAQNVLDPDDWKSLGPEQSMCCGESYARVTRPTNPVYRTAFDSDKVAGFSAQGPVRDDPVTKGEFAGDNPPAGMMRIKPDIVAPGAYLVGANSPGVSNGAPLVRHCRTHQSGADEAFDENNTLVAMGGTSVATAAVAGLSAIARQYFEDGFYPSGRRVAADRLTPSAALIKALLITSAESVQQSASSTDAPCKTYGGPRQLLTKSCVPNYQEGWGRPNLGSILWLNHPSRVSSQLWVADEMVGFPQSGWVHEYQFLINMTLDKVVLKVSLVWSDPPPLPGAEVALVNDLDLVVDNGMSVGWINGKICELDPFTNDYYSTQQG